MLSWYSVLLKLPVSVAEQEISEIKKQVWHLHSTNLTKSLLFNIVAVAVATDGARWGVKDGLFVPI